MIESRRPAAVPQSMECLAMETKVGEKCFCESRVRHLEQQVQALTSQVETIERSFDGLEDMKQQVGRLEISVEQALKTVMPRVEMMLVDLESRCVAPTVPTSKAVTEGARVALFSPSAPPPSYEDVASGSASCLTNVKLGVEGLNPDLPSGSSEHGSLSYHIMKSHDRTNPKKRSALEVASEKGYTSSVETLLRCGAASDQEQLDAALVAAGNTVILNLLLDAGADPNSRDADDCSALHCAARKGLSSCVASLLTAGAALEARDKWGNTALHVAVQCDKGEVVKVLIAAGAMPEATNNEGKTPQNLVMSPSMLRLLGH